MIDDSNYNNIDNNITDYRHEEFQLLKMMKKFFLIQMDG
jgi:hypothetical protein